MINIFFTISSKLLIKTTMSTYTSYTNSNRGSLIPLLEIMKLFVTLETYRVSSRRVCARHQ